MCFKGDWDVDSKLLAKKHREITSNERKNQEFLRKPNFLVIAPDHKNDNDILSAYNGVFSIDAEGDTLLNGKSHRLNVHDSLNIVHTRGDALD